MRVDFLFAPMRGNVLMSIKISVKIMIYDY